MKIPQLVHEIIDYYLYCAQWKNGIKKVNMEYIGKFQLIDHITYGDILFYEEKKFYYNWRPTTCMWLWKAPLYNLKLGYHPNVARLPLRYMFYNTTEQLKSLYF